MSQLKEKLLQLAEIRWKTLPALTKQSKFLFEVGFEANAMDPVAFIVRCHLLTEVILDKLLQFVLEPNGDAVLYVDLTYKKKLDIASRCVLAEDYMLLEDYVVGSLRKLNKIRNRLAHQLDAEVTREEVIELFMGIEYPMTINLQTADISLIIYHYMGFI
ncbi:MAG: hypothetical protein WBL25_07115, partial [Anaerolineales bacterium]